MPEQDVEKAFVDEKRDLSDGDTDVGATSSSEPIRKINWRNTFAKMFIDCITLGALVNTTLFLILMGIMKGYKKEAIIDTVQKVGTPLY